MSEQTERWADRMEETMEEPLKPRWGTGLVRLMAIGTGGLVVLAVAAVVVFSVVWFARLSTTTGPGAGRVSASGPGCTKSPTEVRAVVKQQMAQGLHLAPDQLLAKLQAGESLRAIAIEQGLTPDQLQRAEIDSYQAALDRQVSEGHVTRQDADQMVAQVQSYPPTELDGFVTSLYLCSG